MWQAVMYAAIVAHFAFLAFGLFGGFLAWRWPRIILFQVAAAAWLLTIVLAGPTCPLTWVEDRARERAGLPAQTGGFIQNHVAGVFYPVDHERTAQIIAGLVVLSSWAGLLVAARRRRRADNPSRPRRSRPDPADLR